MPKFSTMTALKSRGKEWKRQVHSAVNTWNSAMLLCAVTEVYRRQRNQLFSNRKMNVVYILEELGKALANRGNRLAGKWCLTSESRYENRDTRRNGNKRLQRQWYGILKENALLGNFQHAPQTHYKPLPMKLKCFWCVVKIWKLQKQFCECAGLWFQRNSRNA